MEKIYSYSYLRSLPIFKKLNLFSFFFQNFHFFTLLLHSTLIPPLTLFEVYLTCPCEGGRVTQYIILYLLSRERSSLQRTSCKGLVFVGKLLLIFLHFSSIRNPFALSTKRCQEVRRINDVVISIWNVSR